MKREVIITDADSRGEDEWYTEWYQCSNPKCHCTSLARSFKYCPDCGWKLNWQLNEEVN